MTPHEAKVLRTAPLATPFGDVLGDASIAAGPPTIDFTSRGPKGGGGGGGGGTATTAHYNTGGAMTFNVIYDASVSTAVIVKMRAVQNCRSE